ncbi:MAG: hypothetical protein PUC82_04255 [bacterium]|nr:hypothetical protein [bacterium]
MNVIVANEQQTELSKLDIDIIKNITGAFEASVLIEMFKTFFFNKMILDVTALKNYDNIASYKELISGLDAEKIIFYLPENTSLCTANFLSGLINIGIYNFTTNLDGVKYLTKHSNTLKDVEHILSLSSASDPVKEQPKFEIPKQKEPEKVPASVGPKIIGIRNLTKQAGSTTFIYMLKNELTAILGKNSVLAIEIDKNDFNVFSDKEMIVATKEDVRAILRRAINYKIILVDLNDFPDESICSDIYYLLEPSIIKLNRLIRRSSNVFEKLRGRKIILNKSLLTDKDIADFEYEARTTVFYNMPPLDDRKRNEAMYNFILKAGLVEMETKENPNKVFGLFRR